MVPQECKLVACVNSKREMFVCAGIPARQQLLGKRVADLGLCHQLALRHAIRMFERLGLALLQGNTRPPAATWPSPSTGPPTPPTVSRHLQPQGRLFAASASCFCFRCVQRRERRGFKISRENLTVTSAWPTTTCSSTTPEQSLKSHKKKKPRVTGPCAVTSRGEKLPSVTVGASLVQKIFHVEEKTSKTPEGRSATF